jgi:hypothetical protein
MMPTNSFRKSLARLPIPVTNVPKEVKDYHERVLAYFPDTKENFEMLDVRTGHMGKGADLMP